MEIDKVSSIGPFPAGGRSKPTPKALPLRYIEYNSIGIYQYTNKAGIHNTLKRHSFQS
jgi:hypothetical protein